MIDRGREPTPGRVAWRPVSRRAVVGAGLGVAGAAVVGVAAARMGWTGRLDRLARPGRDRQPGPEVTVFSQRLAYSAFHGLLDASEAVVLGTLDSVEEYSSLPTIGKLGADPIGTSSGQWLSVTVAEVLKGDAALAGISLRIAHNVDSEYYRDDAPPVRFYNGPLSLHSGATVVAFLGRKTGVDGSRYWGLNGEPSIAEVQKGRLVFDASEQYLADLADEIGRASCRERVCQYV